MASTQEVVDHHNQCFAKQDLKGVLSDYTSHSVLLLEEGVFTGPEAMVSFFTHLMASLGQPHTVFTPLKSHVEGEFSFATWSAVTPDLIYELGTDTFVVRDGKIVAQTFVSRTRPRY
ncbi:MAG: nuclear transport factor 2 family protein [Gemmatimonadaceae bacterium]